MKILANPEVEMGLALVARETHCTGGFGDLGLTLILTAIPIVVFSILLFPKSMLYFSFKNSTKAMSKIPIYIVIQQPQESDCV
jgi:hypothetical protein